MKTVPNRGSQRDALTMPPNLVRAVKIATGSGFEAERMRKLLMLFALAAKGRVAEAEVERAVAALNSGREPEWPPEVSAARSAPAVSANRIAKISRRLAEAEATFAALGLPANESRLLAPYVRYAYSDWMPYVPGLSHWPAHVASILGERYLTPLPELLEPTDADVADASAEIEANKGALIRELVELGLDSATAHRVYDRARDLSAWATPALQQAAERGDDLRLVRQSPAWECAITIGILVRTLAEPTPERVSGTEKYLQSRLLAANSDRRMAEAVKEAVPTIRKDHSHSLGADGGRAGRGKAKAAHTALIHRARARTPHPNLKAVLQVLRDENEVERLAMKRPPLPILAVRIDDTKQRVTFEYGEDRNDVTVTFEAVEKALSRAGDG